MTEYKVHSTDTRNFNLTTSDGKGIGHLEYEKWFSFKSTITLADHSTFQVGPKGFWGTTIELKNKETVLLKFTMNWNGNIIIQSKFDNIERDFVFKHQGILKSAYILSDRNERELVVVQPDFKWSTFNYDYKIQTTDTFEQFDFKNILLLSIVHCANYYMTMMTTIIAAT